jgi:hypothetical protein
MVDFLRLLVHVLVSPFKSQAQLEAEIVVLRHQLNVLRRSVPSKLRLTVSDRWILVWLLRIFSSIRSAVQIVRPRLSCDGTVLASGSTGAGNPALVAGGRGSRVAEGQAVGSSKLGHPPHQLRTPRL